MSSELGQVLEVPVILEKMSTAFEDSTVAPPEKPEKPTYEKPLYSGAWPIAGLCRGRYNEDEGIVIQAGGRYFVVKQAEPCETPYVNGFVEDDGEPVTLNLGRDGRVADVVRLTDRETYIDDQRAYREQVAQAQSDFKASVAAYPQLLREWEADVAATARKRAAALSSRDELVRRWREVLGCDRAQTAASPPAPAAPGRDSPAPQDAPGTLRPSRTASVDSAGGGPHHASTPTRAALNDRVKTTADRSCPMDKAGCLLAEHPLPCCSQYSEDGRPSGAQPESGPEVCAMNEASCLLSEDPPACCSKYPSAKNAASTAPACSMNEAACLLSEHPQACCAQYPSAKPK
ncbi:MAG: hypothetical protein K8W52_15460 [Deltaproteobacteria bacterium]|nr:hypothetical protein [Deltaproteobacteria bacterium]